MIRMLVLAVVILSASITIAQETNQNPDLFVIRGTIQDAYSQRAIGNDQIGFNDFGPEILMADLDDRGNFVMVFDRTKVSFPMRMKFKIDGYKKFVARGIDPDENEAWLDIDLEPVDRTAPADERSWVSTAYTSTLVLQTP